ncbi:MAG TPA: winged helix DNA-binding domain-containing protein [Gaiellaceae bacterium]
MSLGAERVLTERELNRAVLARQLLLERARTPLPRALERIGGIQAQYAPSMYVGLWSRLAGFERDRLTRALGRRTVVQGTLMRATIHLVSRGDYWPLALAIRDARRAWWIRVHKGLTERDAAQAAALMRGRLERGLTARAELIEGLDAQRFNGTHIWLDIVRIPPSGTWERRRADRYALAEEWIGPPETTPEDGLELLARRYLQGFGPGAPAEIADWAGLPIRQVNATLEALELRRFRDERGGMLVDLPRLPLPAADTPAPPRFLPVWDATLLAHARRAQILPEQHRAKVFSTKTPQSTETFTVDGQVAGAWKWNGKCVELRPFGGLPRDAREQLDDEARGLDALHAPPTSP